MEVSETEWKKMLDRMAKAEKDINTLKTDLECHVNEIDYAHKC